MFQSSVTQMRAYWFGVLHQHWWKGVAPLPWGAMALALRFLFIHALCTADIPTPVYGQESSTCSCWSSTLCRRRRRGRFPCIFGGWLKSPPTTPDYHRLVRAGAKWPARPLINYCLVDSLRLHRRLRIIKMFFSGHSVDYWSTAAIVSVRIYIYVFCVLYR